MTIEPVFLRRVAPSPSVTLHTSISIFVLAASLLATTQCAPLHAANEYRVTNVRDAGPGSLRQAMLDANRDPGPGRIRFDSVKGPFAEPRTITLGSALPTISDDVEIDGYIENRLWVPTGVTIDGAGKFPVFRVAEGILTRLRYLTVTRGQAPEGGALSSAGNTQVEGVMFFANQAETGGAVAQLGGSLWLINSTLLDNRARRSGGGVAIIAGDAVVTHCTLMGNGAPHGAGLHSDASLRMSNSIVSNSAEGEDCESSRPLDPRSTRNVIHRGEGCGKAFYAGNPLLGRPDYFNGPTRSIPLLGGSPAVNWADNAASVDPEGRSLVWDQRGNGDPRFAAGIADIGAFERQAVTVLEIDIREDIDVRGCSSASRDCSLRGAIAIANASPRDDAITFRPGVFGETSTIELTGPLPRITKRLSLSAGKDQSVRITGSADWVTTAPGVELEVRGVVLPGSER
ncbi:MAG: choice-of-anchor Q domain-containing protein [Panacagrimonas sp.]